MDPGDGTITPLTRCTPPSWNFRASESADGRQIIFCRAATGGSPAIWVMDANGNHARELTKGFGDRGADHPRWLPLQS
jgi:TolB protein